MTNDIVRGRSCSIAGCGRDHYGRGWCGVHYMRWHRHGDPLTCLLGPHVTQHGTNNEYQNYGCRCDECRAAGAEHQRMTYKTPCSGCGAPVWRRGLKPTTGLCRRCLGETRRTAVHGTESRYTGGCRCDECRGASRDARRRRRARVAA